MPDTEDTSTARMVRHSPMTIPRLIEGESPTLIANTTTYGLYAIKVTHYDAYDEDSAPHWSTACSSAYTIHRSQILWWAYADEVLALVEACSLMSIPNAGTDESCG